MTIFLGIDPGQSGGLAWIHGSSVIHPVAMPGTDADILDALTQDGRIPITCAALEAVHSFPGQGVASSFTFGVSFGGLRMALSACGIPFDLVSPVKWQRALGIPAVKGETKTERKRKLREKAQQLFPALKITNATADAVLLAEYCRRLKTGQLKP